MIRLRRKARLRGRSPMQKLLRRSSKESVTEPSSSLNFNDDDFGDFLNQSPQSLVQTSSDSIYTADQVVITLEDAERQKFALHSSFGDSERSSRDFDVSSSKKKKKKKKKTKSRQPSQEERKTRTKSKKSSPKAKSVKTKKKQQAQQGESSPFWSLSSMMTSSMMEQNSHQAAHHNSDISEGFAPLHISADDESFVSHDGSILLPSKASMEASDERAFLSPREGRSRCQRSNGSTDAGMILTPSKASLERMDSSKSAKKKRRPKQSSLSPKNEVRSPNGKQITSNLTSELEEFLSQSASGELRPSGSSQSQSSQGSQKSKSKKTKSVSPKKNGAVLPPAIEDKPSSFSGLQINSFKGCDEKEEESSKIKQPSKASLESMLERVTIRKKTRKGSSSASVGSVRRGKRPQIDSSDHSVVSLDTGIVKKTVNQALRQDSFSGEQSAAMSVGTRKKSRRPGAPRPIPRRAASYRSNLTADDTISPSSMQPSKATLQKSLEKRGKNRKMAGSRRTELSPERSSTSASMNSPQGISPRSILKGNRRTELSPERPSAPASTMKSPSGGVRPEPILKSKRRISFGDETSEPMEPIAEPKIIVQRRASFNGSSKHPLVHALTGYNNGENSKEEAKSSPKRRGTRSPIAKGKKPASRLLSPKIEQTPLPTINAGSADDPWDSIDEAFMPMEKEHKSSDVWASLALLDEDSSSRAPDSSTRSGPCSPISQQQQQLKATEFMDAWWNVQDGDDKNLLEASRKKRLAQKSMLLVSSNSIRSMKSSSEFKVDGEATQDTNATRSRSKSPSGCSKSKSPPQSTVAKTPMHVSMPLPSLGNGSSHKSSLKSAPAHSPRNKKKEEVSDAWWDEDTDDANFNKKKQLARKSVLLVGHSSISFAEDDYDYDDDDEEDKVKLVLDPRSGRRVVQYPGGRRPANLGRLAVTRRKMQPVSKKAQTSSDNVLGSPQEQQQKKVAAAFKF